MGVGAIVFWALLALVVTGVISAVASALWPFQRCPRCQGSGRRTSPSGKNYGRCRRCKGAGERLRFGRRVMNKIGVAKDKLIG